LSDARLKSLSRAEKVAILLISLGEDLAAELLQQLPHDDAQRVVHAMAKVGRIDPRLVEALQSEFQTLLASFKPSLPTGSEAALRIVSKAFGDEHDLKLLKSLPRQTPESFRIAEQVEAKILWQILQQEHPQTLAVVLAYLSPKKSGDLAKQMPTQLRTEVLSRLAQTKDIKPEALDAIDEILTKALATAQHRSTQSLGGAKKTAEILAHFAPEQRHEILNSLEQSSPPVAAEVRAGMFTFDDLIKLTPRDFETLLKSTPSDDLEMALRQCPDAIAKLIYGAMSSRRAEQMQENIAAARKVPLSKIQDAQRKIAALASALIESGAILDPLDEVV
jgi:flagellar motor switch protein FliG